MRHDTLWAREREYDEQYRVGLHGGKPQWNPWRWLRQIFQQNDREPEAAYAAMQKDVAKWHRLGRKA